MKKTGLNVSYDTILRGILKPSELRLLEKQKKYLGDIDEKPGDGNEVQPEPQRVNWKSFFYQTFLATKTKRLKENFHGIISLLKPVATRIG